MIRNKFNVLSIFGGLALVAFLFLVTGSLTANAQTVDKSDTKIDTSKLVAINSPSETAKSKAAFPNSSSSKPSSSNGTWSGFYVGGYGGGAFDRSTAQTSTVFTSTGYFAATSVPAIAASGNQKLNPNAFTGGGTFGYNYQSGNFVVGAEVDFGALTANKTVSTTTVYPCCSPAAFTITQSMKTRWLFTARPRIGYAFGNALIYGTGGLALTDINYQARFTDTFASATENGGVNKTQLGWTVGGGGEYKVSKNWSIKGEYLYADFRTVTNTSTNLMAGTPPVAYPSNPFTHTADLKVNSVRFGVNFHF